jgi:hypothetical protein
MLWTNGCNGTSCGPRYAGLRLVSRRRLRHGGDIEPCAWLESKAGIEAIIRRQVEFWKQRAA